LELSDEVLIVSKKFHERFGIDVDIEESRRRFVNRINNEILGTLFYESMDYHSVKRAMLTVLGKDAYVEKELREHTGDDFYENLRAVEAFYQVAPHKRDKIEVLVKMFLGMSEIDMGIRWENGQFVRSGAKMLDDKLVNENLDWLSDPRFETVLTPFRKGLNHYVHSAKNQDFLYDVITDMYESLEALAKIVTGRIDNDLSSNRELFIAKINASDKYKIILKEYIDYANDYRHALKEGEKRPALSNRETESFLYLTGLFLRMAMP
jgi:hypothetical protein